MKTLKRILDMVVIENYYHMLIMNEKYESHEIKMSIVN